MVANQQKIEEKIEELLEEQTGYFLTHLKISKGNKISVFIDADEGASIDILAKINKALRKKIDELGLFSQGDFSLEVSSPGLDEPLQNKRQYKKNIGREVEVLQKDGIKKIGILSQVEDQSIVLKYEEKKRAKGKKNIGKKEPEEIPFETIKYTKVCIGF